MTNDKIAYRDAKKTFYDLGEICITQIELIKIISFITEVSDSKTCCNYGVKLSDKMVQKSFILVDS